MSHQPKPPACIANAVAKKFRDDYGTLEFTVDKVARAVWDALLREGEIYRDSTKPGAHRTLVLELGPEPS